MTSFRDNRGYTFIELMLVIGIISIIFVGVVASTAFFAGNMWFLEDDVLRCAQNEDDNVEKIAMVDRNVFDYSVVTVLLKDYTKVKYYVDTSIIFDANCSTSEVVLDRIGW